MRCARESRASAFALPEPFTFGNDSTTEPSLRAPGQFNWDLLLSKSFHLGDKLRLAFRAEFFNAFNHFNPGLPNTTIGDPGVGEITTGNNPKNIQWALKAHRVLDPEFPDQTGACSVKKEDSISRAHG